VSLQKICKNFK